MFVSWGGISYSCNPRFIAESILADEECADFDLNFAFYFPERIKEISPRITRHTLGSLSYYYKIATSGFIVSNTIFAGEFFPRKRKGQIYIQSQHGGRGIKKIDFDDAEHLSPAFLKTLEEDTKRTDLLLSESAFRTKVIRSAFRYDGEVLEKGLPRNSIFFLPESSKEEIKTRVRSALNIPDDAKCLIYAPTFRGNGRTDVYIFDADKVVTALTERFGGDWYILIASHPNMKSYYHTIYDFSHPRIIDVGRYENMQEMLLLADVLMTDYSSTEFDFSLQQKPIFSYVKDADSYDRGLYIHPKDLPFPYATTEGELCRNILSFDQDKYLVELIRFETDVMGLHESGHASEAVVAWMMEHIKN